MKGCLGRISRLQSHGPYTTAARTAGRWGKRWTWAVSGLKPARMAAWFIEWFQKDSSVRAPGQRLNFQQFSTNHTICPCRHGLVEPRLRTKHRARPVGGRLEPSRRGWLGDVEGSLNAIGRPWTRAHPPGVTRSPGRRAANGDSMPSVVSRRLVVGGFEINPPLPHGRSLKAGQRYHDAQSGTPVPPAIPR